MYREGSDILSEQEIQFSSYHVKLRHILNQDKSLLISMNNDEKIDYIFNHFIISDFEEKQMSLFIKKKGKESFLELIESIE